jgi:hypothetical protein
MGARFSCSLLSCAKNLFEQANLGPWCWHHFRVVPVQHLHQSAQAWKILLRPRSAHSIQMRDQMQGAALSSGQRPQKPCGQTSGLHLCDIRMFDSVAYLCPCLKQRSNPAFQPAGSLCLGRRPGPVASQHDHDEVSLAAATRTTPGGPRASPPHAPGAPPRWPGSST